VRSSVAREYSVADRNFLLGSVIVYQTFSVNYVKYLFFGKMLMQAYRTARIYRYPRAESRLAGQFILLENISNFYTPFPPRISCLNTLTISFAFLIISSPRINYIKYAY
jgi:hypothetical protein